jgi:predicted O-methyltransferase YrrM
MDAGLREAAEAAIGFMPEPEGMALYRAARQAATAGPLLEVGTYCGKSAVYLGAAAREAGTVVFTVDHHRGSEENQPGWEYHDERLVDSSTGRLDTLPCFRRTMTDAGLEGTVIGVVGPSAVVAAHWATPLAFVLVDGGHTEDAARGDYEGWAPHLQAGGLLAVHDVFPDPAHGGRAPFHVYRRALSSGAFEEVGDLGKGSLRVLRRVGPGW